jgi:hypothetical protein
MKLSTKEASTSRTSNSRTVITNGVLYCMKWGEACRCIERRQSCYLIWWQGRFIAVISPWTFSTVTFDALLLIFKHLANLALGSFVSSGSSAQKQLTWLPVDAVTGHKQNVHTAYFVPFLIGYWTYQRNVSMYRPARSSLTLLNQPWMPYCFSLEEYIHTPEYARKRDENFVNSIRVTC